MVDEHEPTPTPRLLVSFVVVAVVASLVALSLGEYELDFPLPVVAGVFLSLVLGEVVISVGRQRHPVIGAYVGMASALAIALAGTIDANDVEPVKGWVWAGVAAAFVVGFLRCSGLRGPGRR